MPRAKKMGIYPWVAGSGSRLCVVGGGSGLGIRLCMVPYCHAEIPPQVSNIGRLLLWISVRPAGSLESWGAGRASGLSPCVLLSILMQAPTA